MSGRARAAGLLLGVLADAAVGDPRRGHPVAGFGRLAAALEHRLYLDRRSAGAGYAALLVGGAAAIGLAAEWLGRSRPVVQTCLTGVASWAVLGGASLAAEGVALAVALDRADLAGARRRIPNLCGRDPALLDLPGMARAGVESVAENTSDAVVAPLLWGAVAGAPGLLGYRAVNTLDAMVGYRSPRYARFGWAAARADDLANLVPARVAAALVVAAAPFAAGSARGAWRIWWRDGKAHASPNAGRLEAAAAGALGLRLGGPTGYRHGMQQRAELGDGAPPTAADLRRVVRLSRLVGAAAAGLSAAVAVTLGQRPRLGRRSR